MNSAPSYSEQLVAGIHSDPDYPSFGGRIAELSESALARGDSLPPDAEKLIEVMIHAVRHLITSTRTRDLDIQALAYDRFNHADMRLFKQGMQTKISADPGSNIYRWIVTPRGDQYRDVAHLMVWNRNRRQEFQNQLNRDAHIFHANTLERVDHLIEEGVYPPEALDIYRDSITRHGNYRAMDSFESGLMGADGWCDDDNGKLSLSNLYRDPSKLEGAWRLFTSVAFHEETHSAGSDGRGFYRGVATEHLPTRSWEEFWASHSQAVTDKTHLRKLLPEEYTDGRPYVLNPDARHDILRYYQHEGRYAWNIHTLSGEGIPADLVGHAYISKFDPIDPSPERVRMERSIVRVFGSTAQWLDFEDDYESQPTRRERENRITETIRRLNDNFSYNNAANDFVTILTEKLVD